MTQTTALTMDNNSVYAVPYDGRREQSFYKVAQGDSSVGLRNKYTGLALCLRDGVSVRNYDGNQDQSLELVLLSDGAVIIRNMYQQSTVLEMDDNGVRLGVRDDNNPNRKFHFVDQSDGSIGIRMWQ